MINHIQANGMSADVNNAYSIYMRFRIVARHGESQDNTYKTEFRAPGQPCTRVVYVCRILQGITPNCGAKMAKFQT